MKYFNKILVILLLCVSSCSQCTPRCPFEEMYNLEEVSNIKRGIENTLSANAKLNMSVPKVNIGSLIVDVEDSLVVADILEIKKRNSITYDSKEITRHNQLVNILCGTYRSLSDDNIAVADRARLSTAYTDAVIEYLQILLKMGKGKDPDPLPEELSRICEEIENYVNTKLVGIVEMNCYTRDSSIHYEFTGMKDFYKVGVHHFDNNVNSHIIPFANLIADIPKKFGIFSRLGSARDFSVTAKVDGSADSTSMTTPQPYKGDKPTNCVSSIVNSLGVTSNTNISFSPNQAQVTNEYLGCARASFFADYLIKNGFDRHKISKSGQTRLDREDGRYRNVFIRVTLNNVLKSTDGRGCNCN